jgi:hypothetical protein
MLTEAAGPGFSAIVDLYNVTFQHTFSDISFRGKKLTAMEQFYYYISIELLTEV